METSLKGKNLLPEESNSLKERICSQRERILSFKSSYLWYRTHFYSLECYYFITHVRTYVMGATPMAFADSLAGALMAQQSSIFFILFLREFPP